MERRQQIMKLGKTHNTIKWTAKQKEFETLKYNGKKRNCKTDDKIKHKKFKH